MPSTVKVAFIGAGLIGGVHIDILEHLPDVQIAGITDQVRERAARHAERIGTNAYTDLREMLDREKPDAAYVCVPPYARGVPEQALIERHIPFFVEKPLATSLETATMILEAVERRNILTAVGYHWRQLDSIQRVRADLQVHAPRLALGYWLDKTPRHIWWQHHSESGGQMLEQTTHILDLARYLIGEVKNVFALTSFKKRERYPEADVHDVSTATLEFKNGTVGTVSSTCILNSPYHIGLNVICEGVVYECTESQVCLDRGASDREIWMPRHDPFVLEDEEFINALRDGDTQKKGVPYREAYQTHLLVNRCVESAQKGEPLSIE